MKLEKLGRLSVPLLMIVSLVCAPEVHARGLYVQAEINQTYVDENVDDTGTAIRLDGHASGWRFAAGYEFNDHLAVEVGHTDFGTVSESLAGITATAGADGQELAIVGRLPLGQKFAVLGRAGTVWWDGSISVDDVRADLSDQDIFFGAGLEFRPDDRFAIGATVSKYRFDELDFGTAALSVKVRF